ncbi:hypothetical protein V6N11_077362 [Hibiscus sabdariffa]|uniref:Uncharacterized protein n=1 Tax=Hibiscus sabdariffa TaxID=183260 RepID=A0ABR2TCV6_9ROSI
MTMDEESELIVIDDTKVLSELTKKIDEEPDDSAKDLRVVSQDKVPISEWCDDLKKVLLRQPLVQHVNFNANLVTRKTVHGMGTRSTIQNVMPGICFELILMNQEGKSSGVNRLVRQKQGLRLMVNDETHVFDEMSARVDFCFNQVKKITGNCTRLQGFSMFNAMGCEIGSGLGLLLQNMWGVLQSYNFVQSKLFDHGIFFNNVDILIECRIKVVLDQIDFELWSLEVTFEFSGKHVLDTILEKIGELKWAVRVDTFEGTVHKNTSNERLICNVKWRRLICPSLLLLDSSRKNEKKLVVKGNEVLASVFWELNLLSKHYPLTISTPYSEISNMNCCKSLILEVKDLLDLKSIDTCCCVQSRDKLIQYHKKRAIGEDFRDEVFYTNRYLCEITSFNVEKEIKRYYFEGMDIREKLIVTMFDGFDERCQKKFGVVGEQYPFKTWKHKSKILRFISGDGIQILENDDMKIDPLGNLNMEAERKLDQLILGKYDIENYILHYYALTVRFFYAMPCHSNSCDVLVRGEKIISETHEVEVSRGQARIREVLFAENIVKLHANKSSAKDALNKDSLKQ